MGVIFQTAVVEESKSAVEDAIRAFPAGTVQLRVRRRAKVGVVLFPLGDDRGLHERADALTRDLSRTFGRALFVQYDDRVGLREAVHYQAGEPTRRFGAADELWVPLDADGNRRSDAPPVRIDELDSAEEYETVATALDRGLEAFGVNPPLTGLKLRDLVLAAE